MYKAAKNINIVVFALAITLLFGSCSTRKNTFVRRKYHDINAHYNAYFNGRESIKEGVNELWRVHEDNYSKILRVYKYGDETQGQSVAPQMDRAIEKGGKVINRHSFAKYDRQNQEHCKWIDDSYMLIGKAQFYKQEYRQAEQLFKFVIKTYKKNDIIYDAKLWLARTFIQLERYDDAFDYLNQIKNSEEKSKFSRAVKNDLPLVFADYYIIQEDYEYAIEHLLEALKSGKKKKMRVRATFILAQIYQETDLLSVASKYYGEVIKMNPEYVMAFSAKINMAKCFDAEARGDSKLIKKELTKMLKDDKNKEYLDQIYYALSTIAFKESDTTNGIEYLKLSAANSFENANQLATTFLKLGDIFFIQPDYEMAQAYYDSCVTSLPNDFPDYEKIVAKRNTLSDLVKNLNVVLMEDSMQTLANMSEAERSKAVDKMIAEMKKEEQKKKQEAANKQRVLAQIEREKRERQNSLGSASKWYFYNPTAMSFGMKEFTKRWGDRKLEDLWRLSNKKITSFDGFSEDSEEQADSLASLEKLQGETKKYDKNALMEKIPTTPEKLIASNLQIMEAYYNLGIIYKEGLGDVDKAIEAYETLLERFPDSEYELKTYYQLYRLYLDQNDAANTQKYKKLITSKYPDSDYAKIILNPDYYKILSAEKSKDAILYEKTWNNYNNANYSTVISSCDTAISTIEDKSLLPKFDLLKALSIGKTSEQAPFKIALQQVVKKYPETSAQKEAQLIIDFLDGKFEEKKAPPKDTSMYKMEPNADHMYIIIVSNSADVNKIKNEISNYNNKFHRLDKLRVKSLVFSPEQQMISVGKIKGQKKAVLYYNNVMNEQQIMSILPDKAYKHYVISSNNYITLYKEKECDPYQEFFIKQYLKSEKK